MAEPRPRGQAVARVDRSRGGWTIAGVPGKEEDMRKSECVPSAVLAGIFLLLSEGAAAEGRGAVKSHLVQAQAVLTVSEGKRLIGKAVAEMPIVRRALRDGTVIIARGTTNTYVAEEILGREIERGAFVTGKVYPAKGGKRFRPSKRLGEMVIRRGKLAEGVSFDEALGRLKPGDVVIKGANALDYEDGTAGILIGHPAGGTIGKAMPYVIARKAHLVIPVGLEKQVAGSVEEIATRMREPVESVNRVPSMFLVRGHIVTEIEALKILAEVDAFQAAAGGIGGAEGSVRLVFRGTREKVEEALRIIGEVQGEPPFVE